MRDRAVWEILRSSTTIRPISPRAIGDCASAPAQRSRSKHLRPLSCQRPDVPAHTIVVRQPDTAFPLRKPARRNGNRPDCRPARRSMADNAVDALLYGNRIRLARVDAATLVAVNATTFDAGTFFRYKPVFAIYLYFGQTSNAERSAPPNWAWLRAAGAEQARTLPRRLPRPAPSGRAAPGQFSPSANRRFKCAASSCASK